MLVSGRVGWRGEGHRQLPDRWWQIFLAANVHLSAYWRALSQRWFMHAATSITSNIPRSDTSPYPSADAKSGLVISASHAVRLVRRRWDLSLGRICTFPLSEETSAVSLWMTLFIIAQKAPVFNIVKANSCCQITKIAGGVHTLILFLLCSSLNLPLFSLLIPPSSLVISGLIKARVVLQLQCHARGYHTQSLLGQMLNWGVGGVGVGSNYSHPTPPFSSSSLDLPAPNSFLQTARLHYLSVTPLLWKSWKGAVGILMQNHSWLWWMTMVVGVGRGGIHRQQWKSAF